MMRVKIHYDDLDRAKYIHCTPCAPSIMQALLSFS